MAEHEQQVWLLRCLDASLNADQETRKAAEQALKEASCRQGYGVTLAKVVLNTSIAMGIRQLAAVLLKHYVQQHWPDDNEGYVTPAEDKASIKALLPLALGDSHGKIRTAVGMAIASIAALDWPEEWPELMGYLLECINDQIDVNKVHGALRCLSLVADDIDSRQVPHIIPVLFPTLYSIASSPSVHSSVRKAALTIVHGCIGAVGIMSGAHKSETKAIMQPMLKTWMELFASVLSTPVQPENPEDWGLKKEVLKALLQTVVNFPKLAFAEFSVVLGPLFQTLVSSLQVYQNAAVQGDQEVFAGLACSDGSDQSLESLGVQLLEFLTTLVGLRRYAKFVQQNSKDLAYYAIGYMQMTDEQEGEWSEDPNEFIMDEEITGYSCRVCGAVFLEELLEKHGRSALCGILEAVSKRIEDAEAAKLSEKTDWWKLREAAFMAIGSLDFQDEYPDISVDNFVNKVLLEDIRRGANANPFLYGRALWAASKLHSALNKENRVTYFLAAVEGLSHHTPAVVVGSCRALSVLISEVDPAVSSPHLVAAYSSLGSLLEKATDESLYLVLETINPVVSVTKNAVADSILSPMLVHIWLKHASDPFITVEVLETLEAIKNIPGCKEHFTMRSLQSIAGILMHPRSSQEGLVAAALDFLTMLLKDATPELVKNVYHVTFNSVVNIMRDSDDHSELQNGTECLTRFIHCAGENVLTWSNDPNNTMKALLDIAARLVHPDMDSSGAFFAGTYLVQLIQRLSGYMAPYLRDLVTALVLRLENLKLKSSLILVFARLVHMSAPNYSQFVDLLASVPSSKYVNALNCVMSEWTSCHGEIQGAYGIKVSTTALAQLLACQHPQLSQVLVQGRCLTEGAETGPMTRSRRKAQPAQWTTVSLPEKIFSLLVETLAELGESGANINTIDEDADWEEVSSGEEVEESSPSGVFKPAEDYAHILNADGDGDVEDDDPSADTDLINKINLQEYLISFLRSFAQQAQPVFSDFFERLPASQKKTVQALLAC